MRSGGGKFRYLVKPIGTYPTGVESAHADSAPVFSYLRIPNSLHPNLSDMKKTIYEAPAVDVLEIRAEQGFAASASMSDSSHESFDTEDYEW